MRMPSSSFCAGTLPISFSTVSCGTASMLLLRSDVRLRAPYRSRRLCDTDGSGELADAGRSALLYGAHRVRSPSASGVKLL
ncbi:hypothetical protein CE91St33_12640 [Eggerthella lenta]|nr:hypothetical protein CE91St33_12640 [Eggerthella lenta]GKG83235.1 hypothetical protein CE91St34_04960 [Eggerthella lenta]GKG87225.1 hypothetical protein CE91St35_13790 [Eggerthella lenta]